MRTLLVFASCAGVAAGATLVALGTAQGSPESTGARLALDWFTDTDVVGFHLEVERVPCNGRGTVPSSTIVANVELGDGLLAAPLARLSQELDPASRHRAADLFVDLEPGCYEVLAVPAAEIVGDAWAASTDCSRAGSGRVRVARGRTSLTSLLPQCVGDRHGRRDVLAGLNRPPALSLQTPELFARAGEPVRACATVTDPDDDPISVSFASASPADPLTFTVGKPTLLGFEDGRRTWQVCADIVGDSTASYEVRAEVHDLGWSLGRMVRLEELVAPEESHASATLPVHVGCTDATCS